uniref:Uncharacterized protein n=1 Tax=Rhizophora mucronata TaxID=61149 RepID=A0A2P2NX21_RHIMU
MRKAKEVQENRWGEGAK